MSEDSDQPIDQQLEPLPAEKLCNHTWSNEPNPIYGDGALGNEKTERMYYGGNDKTKLVITLQKMLKTLDYVLGTSGPDKDGADGEFKDKTEEAVRDFQGKNRDWDGKQLKVDGLVGPDTSDALNRAMVGKWYDHYQTPEKLVEGKPYHTVTTDYMNSGLLIKPGKAKEGKVFLVGLIQWTAAWDRPDEPIKMGEERTMILNAPGLSAEQEVIFEVVQEAEGKKEVVSPPIVVFAHKGGAKGEFSDWYARDRVTYQVNLREGTQPGIFPPVRFAFVAKAAGRQFLSGTLAYCGSIETRLIKVEGELEESLPDVEYTLICPWGRRIGRSDANGIVKVDALPPGGTTIVIGGEVILRE